MTDPSTEPRVQRATAHESPPSTSEGRAHPSSLAWAHYASQSLPWVRRARFARHLRQCAACGDHAASLRRERDAFHGSEVAARTLAALQARRCRRSEASRSWLWLGGTAALGCAVLLGLAMLPQGRALPAAAALQVQAWRRAHSGDQFALYVERADGAMPLGGQCQAGEQLRARYRSDRGYLMVVQVGSGGHAQVVFPEHGSESATIGERADLTPGSWKLDDAPGRERFIAVFSRAPLAARQVLQALRSGTVLTEPGALSVEVTCTKGA